MMVKLPRKVFRALQKTLFEVWNGKVELFDPRVAGRGAGGRVRRSEASTSHVTLATQHNVKEIVTMDMNGGGAVQEV